MTIEIDIYQTVTVTGRLVNSTTFDAHLHIPFPVDEIVVKYIAWFYSSVNSQVLSHIRTPLVNNNTIAVVPGTEYGSVMINTPFQMHGANINGLYTFYVYDYDATLTIIGDMKVAITLMFIKFKK